MPAESFGSPIENIRISRGGRDFPSLHLTVSKNPFLPSYNILIWIAIVERRLEDNKQRETHPKSGGSMHYQSIEAPVGFQAPVLSYTAGCAQDYICMTLLNYPHQKCIVDRVSHQKDSRRGVPRPCLMNLYHTNTYPSHANCLSCGYVRFTIPSWPIFCPFRQS
jgi:hypothetical protein